MSATPEKKHELREINRRKTLDAVQKLLEMYLDLRINGEVFVDIRCGKAIWVRPVITQTLIRDSASNKEDCLDDVDGALRDFQDGVKSGLIELVVHKDRVTEVSKIIELDKVRVG